MPRRIESGNLAVPIETGHSDEPQARAMPEGTCMTAAEFEARTAPLRWSEFATPIGLNSRRR